MRILLTLAVVIGMMATMSATADAQYNQGYQWGAGVAQGFDRGVFRNRRLGGFGLGFRPTPRFDDIPYFAKFPPVYYSGIVKRPYGISPFAAPPGIAPVELSVPQPMTINNPFYNEKAVPVSNEQQPPPAKPNTDKNGNKVTWLRNPYMDSVVRK